MDNEHAGGNGDPELSPPLTDDKSPAPPVTNEPDEGPKESAGSEPKDGSPPKQPVDHNPATSEMKSTEAPSPPTANTPEEKQAEPVSSAAPPAAVNTPEEKEPEAVSGSPPSATVDIPEEKQPETPSPEMKDIEKTPEKTDDNAERTAEENVAESENKPVEKAEASDVPRTEQIPKEPDDTQMDDVVEAKEQVVDEGKSAEVTDEKETADVNDAKNADIASDEKTVVENEDKGAGSPPVEKRAVESENKNADAAPVEETTVENGGEPASVATEKAEVESKRKSSDDAPTEKTGLENEGKSASAVTEKAPVEDDKKADDMGAEPSVMEEPETKEVETGDTEMKDVENLTEKEAEAESTNQLIGNDEATTAPAANVEKPVEKQAEAEDVEMKDVEDAEEKTDVVNPTADVSKEVPTPKEKVPMQTAASLTPAQEDPKKPLTHAQPAPVPVATPTAKTLAPAPTPAATNTTAAAQVSRANSAPTQPTVPVQTPVQQPALPEQQPPLVHASHLIMPGAIPQTQNATVGRPRGRPPSAVGVPAAKRARVNGTLDAGVSIQAPDLSDATLQRYRQAANEIGVRLIATPPGTPRSNDRRKDFLDDHVRYMASLGKTDYKIRTIGGNKLDLFTLYYSVLLRGGVQNVISSRTFRLVGKALNLPKSCTSAAYILRVDYEKLLYAYEQKHVWGRDEDEMPPLHSTDRVRTTPNAVMPAAIRTPQRTRIPVINTPQHATAHAVTPGVSARPKRQAALAASSAVAAAAASDDDDDEPGMELRRTRTAGIDMNSLTPHQEAIVAEEVNANAPHSVFNPNAPGERERVLQALWSANSESVAFALGTFNALSYDTRNNFQARNFPGLLDALCAIMQRHLEDVEKRRRFGLPFNHDGPQVASMAAMDVRDAGVGDNALDEEERLGVGGKLSSLQEYGDLFNCVDNIAVDREQCAVVAVNILRNMSFDEPNAMTLATSQVVMDLAAEMLMNVNVPGNLRDGLIDMWINVSSYLHVAKGQPGHPVLVTCVKLLNPYYEGAGFSRFTNCGEILARLAGSPERNEGAFVEVFPELLPRLVDMIGGKDRRCVNAGLAALCNCSAFDWPARSRIARVPRCMPRLVNMLTDPELAPRAALTLLNLAEAHSNRSVILAYEKQLVEQAIKVSPASDTVATILYDLSND